MQAADARVWDFVCLCCQVFTLRPSYEYWPTLEVHYSFEARKWELKHHFSSSSPTLAA